MAGTLVLDTLQNGAGTASTSADNVINGCAKAWVNFNGATINGSFNVSSVTLNGTGDFTVNYTTAMPNATYGFAAGIEYSNTAFASGVGTIGVRLGGLATGSIRLQSGTLGGTLTTYANASVAIFSN